MNDIVVGVDRSETARTAAVRAAELAAAHQANLHLVMCVDRAPTRHISVGGDHFHTDWLADAELFLADLSRSLPHDRTTRTVGSGDPATFLCEEARRLAARAIVVGNRRVQSIGRVLGSIADDVARHAPCDVVVANTCGAR